MPSGYVAATVWAAAVILWCTGWRKEMAGGIPAAAVAGYLAGWPLLMRLSVVVRPLGEELTVHAGWLWTAAFAAWAAASCGRAKTGTACAAGILLGSIGLFADKLIVNAPAWLPSGPPWIAATAVAVVASMLAKSAAEQVVALTAGLTLTATAVSLWELHAAGLAAFGDSAWADSWWLAFAEIRMISYAAAGLPELMRKYLWRRGGERS